MSIFLNGKSTLTVILSILLFTTSCVSTPANIDTGEQAENESNFAADTLLRNYDNLIVLLQTDQLQDALLLLDSGNAIPSEEAEILMAQLYVSIGEIDEAKKLLVSVEQKNPKLIDLLFLRTQIAVYEGDVNQAITALEEIVAQDPENIRALNALGMTTLEVHAHEKAEKYFEQSMEVDKNIDAMIGLANVYTAQEKRKEAINILNDAIKEQPDNYLLHAELGMVNIREHNFDTAIANFSTSIEKQPDYSWNYFDRARVYMELKQFQKAKTDITNFLKYREDVFLAYVIRAQAHDQLDNKTAAIADYEQAINLRPDYYPAFIPLAVLYYEESNLKSASNFFKRYYNETEKEYSEYALLSAICLMENNEKAVADTYLDTVLSEVKYDSVFIDVIRLFRNKTREYQVKRLVSRTSDDKTVYYRLQFYLGMYYDLQGYQSSAKALYQQVNSEGVKGFAETRLAQWKMETIKQDKGRP